MNEFVVLSNSYQRLGAAKRPELAWSRMLPLGSSAAGASFMLSVPGKFGPAVHTPVSLLKIAVCAAPDELPPKYTSVPSGLSTPGPISCELASQSDTPV